MIEHGTLEANICRHCMNRCANCSHASPFAKPYFMEPAQLEKDLASLKRFMAVQHFFALGGEPLLHPRICDILDIITASGIAKQTGVLTNGMLLSRMPEEFWKKVNILRISAYPKLDRAELALAERKSKQYGFFMGIDYVDLFWKQFKWQPDGSSFHECPWKSACWTVHDAHFYLCPNAAFFPDSFMGLPQNIDGLPIGDDLTEQKLSDYINRKDPFVTCRICRPFQERVKWHEVNTREEWMKEATL